MSDGLTEAEYVVKSLLEANPDWKSISNKWHSREFDTLDYVLDNIGSYKFSVDFPLGKDGDVSSHFDDYLAQNLEFKAYYRENSDKLDVADERITAYFKHKVTAWRNEIKKEANEVEFGPGERTDGGWNVGTIEVHDKWKRILSNFGFQGDEMNGPMTLKFTKRSQTRGIVDIGFKGYTGLNHLIYLKMVEAEYGSLVTFKDFERAGEAKLPWQ